MWTILGAGAIGSLLACQLSRAGIAVNLALRPAADQQSCPKEKTIHLIHGHQTEEFRLPVLPPEEPVDRLILTTKTYQTQAALAGIQPQLQEDALILVLQNGMGTTDWLQAQYPRATLLAGTTTQGAYRQGPNTLIHAGLGETWIGALTQGDAHLARRLTTLWQRHGVPIRHDNNINEMLWIKLGINCAINPLTVIHDCRNGELLDIPDAVTTMKAITEEFSTVYERVFGAAPPEDMFATAQAVARRTGANISSMRQDVLNGNPTEIDAINGYLVARARELGVRCPVNEAILERLRVETP